MIDFLELQKRSEENCDKFKQIKIAVIADTTSSFFVKALKGYGATQKMNFVVYEAGYNQIDQEVFNENSELYDFKPDYIIILITAHKLQQDFYRSAELTKEAFAYNLIEKVTNYYNLLAARLKSKVICFNLSEKSDSIFGNFSTHVKSSFLFQVRKFNYLLSNCCQNMKNFFIFDYSAIENLHGHKNLFDGRIYALSSTIFSLEYLPLIVKSVSDIILAAEGHFTKCVVLDLDNTLWGGIIGDDGLSKIEIGSFGNGKIFTEFQLWLKQLKGRGIILTVCSKNEEKNAKEPFEKHPEMVLKLDDITVFVANWNTKVENIKYIQEILNIGFDSMVFIDDNPFEREMVSTYLPGIIVPNLPEDPADYMNFLISENLFETISFSENDLQRTRQYQEEAKRKEFKTEFANEQEFLASLKMIAHVRPFLPFDFPRLAQLSQRSNQFNLRTIRYTEEDITLIAESSDCFSLSFNLTDKFGDYGLVSMITLHRKEGNLFIDTWIMSCRVLKRGLESFTLNKIVDIAKKNNFKFIIGEYLPTEKNGLVKDHYSNLGFNFQENYWYLNVADYSYIHTEITEL